MIDEIDKKILNILQKNARISNAEIARRVGMAPSGILERMRKLERKGIIQKYEVRLNPKALGLVLTVLIMVKTEERVGSVEIGYELAKISEVQEVYFTAGEYNYLLKARVSDTDALTELLRKFGAIPGVKDTRTTLVLNDIKETLALDLDRVDVARVGGKKGPKKDSCHESEGIS